MDPLFTGNCATILRKLPDKFADLTVTSPPYADNRKGVYGERQSMNMLRGFCQFHDRVYEVLCPESFQGVS